MEAKRFENLGVLLSTKGGTLFRVDTLKKFMDYMAELDYNTLYMDFTCGFGIDDHPLFCYLKAKYTKEEFKEIDAYAKSKGITIIPTIQTLAHMFHYYRWPSTHSMFDIDDILLAGDERVYKLVDSMIRTMSENFSSKIIHLGLDEAFRLGRGRYCDLHGLEDRKTIMLRHVKKIMEICEKYGVTPEGWGDMFLDAAYGTYNFTTGEELDNVSEVRKMLKEYNLTIHNWQYGGLTKEAYLKNMKKYIDIVDIDKLKFSGAVWNWIRFDTANQYSIKATKAAMEACEEVGVKHFILTTWAGDVGEQSLWSILPTVVAASEFNKGNYDMDKIAVRFKELMGIEMQAFFDMELIDEVAPRDVNKTTPNSSSKYLLFNDPFIGIYDSSVDENERPVYTRAIKALEKWIDHEQWGFMFQTIHKLAQILEYKFDLGVQTRRLYQAGDKEGLRKLANETYSKVIQRIEEFYPIFRRQWYGEYMHQHFEVNDYKYGGMLTRMKNCKQMLLDYCDGKYDRLDELEGKILDYLTGSEEHVKGAMLENGWQDEYSVL